MSNMNTNTNTNTKLSMIMNASGCHCRTKAQMDALVDAGMQTIITKTCTLAPHRGNPEPVFLEVAPNASVNCLGMPNLGYIYYRDLLLDYKARGIRDIISMDASDTPNLLEMLLDYDTYLFHLKEDSRIPTDSLEYVEINLSCPSTQCPRIISFDTVIFARLLESIRNLELCNIQVGLKLAPFIDKVLLGQIAELISIYQSPARIAYLVCSNSIPNGMVIDTTTSKPVLSIGTGGISGIANKLLGIANVYQFNKILASKCVRKYIKIIGCGGIETGDDIREYIAAGADSVQIGRFLYVNGADCLADIIKNVKDKQIKAKL